MYSTVACRGIALLSSTTIRYQSRGSTGLVLWLRKAHDGLGGTPSRRPAHGSAKNTIPMIAPSHLLGAVVATASGLWYSQVQTTVTDPYLVGIAIPSSMIAAEFVRLKADAGRFL